MSALDIRRTIPPIEPNRGFRVIDTFAPAFRRAIGRDASSAMRASPEPIADRSVPRPPANASQARHRQHIQAVWRGLLARELDQIGPAGDLGLQTCFAPIAGADTLATIEALDALPNEAGKAEAVIWLSHWPGNATRAQMTRMVEIVLELDDPTARGTAAVGLLKSLPRLPPDLHNMLIAALRCLPDASLRRRVAYALLVGQTVTPIASATDDAAWLASVTRCHDAPAKLNPELAALLEAELAGDAPPDGKTALPLRAPDMSGSVLMMVHGDGLGDSLLAQVLQTVPGRAATLSDTQWDNAINKWTRIQDPPLRRLIGGQFLDGLDSAGTGRAVPSELAAMRTVRPSGARSRRGW